MTAPSFFSCDARRAEYAWTAWDDVHAFLTAESVCRIAVNDGPWPYVVAQTYHYHDGSFELRFSRSGKLATCVRANPRVTIEIDRNDGSIAEPGVEHANALYRSVVARCIAETREIDLPPDAGGASRRILAVRAHIETLSAKRREGVRS